jgi:hypothetical protein
MDNRARWAERVAEWKASGLTSVEYCEGKQFTAGGLRHWAYRLRQVEPRRPAALAVRIAKVVPTPAQSPVAPVERPKASESLFVEVGALRVAVRPGFDRATLAAVVEVLATKGASR